MKNKGFTLIEVLAVITILALLGSIIIPIINKDVSNSREILYEQQINNIETAARQYGARHMGILPKKESDPALEITLQTLIDEGFISSQVINPETKKAFSKNTEIRIYYRAGKLNYAVTVKE